MRYLRRDMKLIFQDLQTALYLFFFSSRRRHTRLVSDWSSDVCSSDLRSGPAASDRGRIRRPRMCRLAQFPIAAAGGPESHVGEVSRLHAIVDAPGGGRSEERRVGKERRYRGWRDQ